MRLGTTGFIGQRLKQAREARGISGVDLADMLGVRPQTVYAYQTGDARPSPQIMQVISERLGFPVAYFMRPPLPEDHSGIFWRANNSATRVAQGRAEVRLAWIKELMVYFRDFFEFPAPRLPSLQPPHNFRSLTSDHIEAAAMGCRRLWNLGEGPIPDVVGELEANGVIVSAIKVGVDNLDAFSQWSSLDHTPYIVLSDDKPSAARARFDAAHELGHLILHRNLDRRRLNDSKDWKVLEEQAHRFSSAFLMPAHTFSKEIWAPTLDTFIALKQRWRVSAAAMIMRCKYLGLLTEEQERRLWINRNRRGWQKTEPLDDKIDREWPSLLPKSVEMLVSENVRRKEQILLDSCLPPADLEEVTCMPFGYFRQEPAPVLPMPKRGRSVPPGDGPPGVIVPFGRVREN